jgi:hypothetical protein
VEDALKFRVGVLVWVFANEVDDFPIVIGRLLVIASGLVDHAEAIVAVVDLGEALQKIAGGLLGLVEFSGMDEVDHRVGSGSKFILVLVEVDHRVRHDGPRGLGLSICNGRGPLGPLRTVTDNRHRSREGDNPPFL